MNKGKKLRFLGMRWEVLESLYLAKYSCSKFYHDIGIVIADGNFSIQLGFSFYHIVLLPLLPIYDGCVAFPAFNR